MCAPRPNIAHADLTVQIEQEYKMETAYKIIHAFETKMPVHIQPLSWKEFLETIDQIHRIRNEQE